MKVTAIFKRIKDKGEIVSKEITIDFDPSKYIVRKIKCNS